MYCCTSRTWKAFHSRFHILACYIIVFCCLYLYNYGQRASRSKVSPKMAPFLLVGNRHSSISGFLVVNIVVKLFSSLSTSSTSELQTCFEKVEPCPSYSHLRSTFHNLPCFLVKFSTWLLLCGIARACSHCSNSMLQLHNDVHNPTGALFQFYYNSMVLSVYLVSYPGYVV